MKNYKFYYKRTDGSNTDTVITASNQGIAISRFNRSIKDCLKILKIEKEKKQENE